MGLARFSPVAARSWPLFICLAGLACDSADTNNTPRADVFVAQRGDLAIKVTEQAEIKPSRSTRIKNEMEGQSTILFLVDEGKFVEKGERLVELDSSNLLERKAQQEISLHRAGAAMTSAQKELEIRTKEYEADKLGGENTVRIAEIDLEKFKGKKKPDGTRDMGEQEQELVEAQANIELAEQESKLASNTLEWSVKLHSKGFITKDELERDQLNFQRNQKNVRVEKNKYDILVTFTHVKELIRLEQAIREASTDLEGIIARGMARLAQAEADRIAKEKEYELARERFENLEYQIANSVIYAPTPGLVVYSSESSGRGQQEFVEEGATVRERQTLIELPDVSTMIAELKVHEAAIDKVRAGQRALIRVDTYPDREFNGYVRRVSPVADSGSRWSNSSLKVYKTEVELLGDRLELKPGMSASVTIIVSELKDVVFIPLQAVHRQGSVPYVWLDTQEGPVAHEIGLGVNDFQFVEITEGLAEGDRVFLATPPDGIEPEFEQPTPSAVEAVLPEAIGRPTEAAGKQREQDGGQRQGRRPDEEGGKPEGAADFGEIVKQMTAILESKHPELAEQVKGDRSAWFRNEELRDLVDEDDELRALRDKMMQGFRGRGRPGGSERSGSERGGSERGSEGR